MKFFERLKPSPPVKPGNITVIGTGGAVLTGMVVSLLLIIMSISYPSLIFSGRLEPYSGMGMQMALFSATVFCIVLSLLSTCPGTVGIAQGETAAVLGLAAASIAEQAGSGDVGRIIPTVMATIVLSSLLVGILFTALGRFRLGNLIRFVPLPVMGGFLAGVGWLLASGATKSLTGFPLAFQNAEVLSQPQMLLRWLPGLVSAVILLVLQRRRRTVFNLFVVVAASVGLFWLAAWLIGISPPALKAGGWLIAAGGGHSTWIPLAYTAVLSGVDWRAVLSQLPQLGTLLLIASICVLMAASSLELLSGKDMDLNSELMAAGLGNFACAAAGSLPGYHSLAASALSQQMGTPARTVGLVGAFACALTYFLGVSFLSMLPKMLVGTVIFYIALSLLIEWLFDTWSKLTRADYAILLLVFGCVSLIGLITGVVTGVIAGIALFAFNYGRISIAREVGSSAAIRSNMVYSEATHAVLHDHGEEGYIIKLQGFIFFGTANHLLTRIRCRMLDPGNAPLRCVVIDFKRVFGLDSSAAFSFLKLRQYAENRGFTIALARLSPRIDDSLKAAGTFDGAPRCVLKFDDLTLALEYCEKAIISWHLPEADMETYPISNQLQEAFLDERQAAAFEKYLERIELPEGAYLIRDGDGTDDLFFMERGRVAVIAATQAGAFSRINSMGPGTVVGETAFFLGLPRSASVVVESDMVAHQLTRKSLDLMTVDDPELLIAFQRSMLRLLAERLADANKRSFIHEPAAGNQGGDRRR
jgi:SulP family sulfate permease